MKFNMKQFLAGIGIGLFLVASYFVAFEAPGTNIAVSHVEAYNEGDNSKMCNISPSPSVAPSSAPSDTPMPSQYPSPTITPTMTPTPSLNPSPTPSSNTSNTPSTPSNQAPNPQGAVCTIPFAAPILQGFASSGKGSVIFSWWGVPADKYSITYGYMPDKLIYGADNIPAVSTSFTVNDLQSGAHVWAQLAAWRNGCAEFSKILDPLVN